MGVVSPASDSDEEIERVGHQGSRLRRDARDHLDREHAGIEPEGDQQDAFSPLVPRTLLAASGDRSGAETHLNIALELSPYDRDVLEALENIKKE